MSKALFYPNGRTFFTVSAGDTVRVWHLLTGACLQVLALSAKQGADIFLDPQGVMRTNDKQVVIETAYTLQIGNTENGQFIHSLPHQLCNHFLPHPEGVRLIVGAVSQGVLQIWNIEKKERLYSLPNDQRASDV
jgi:WD40 repeat protein